MSKRRFKSFTELLASAVAFILLALALGLVVDFIRFPECYMPTWKNALEYEIKRGDAEAIDYYNRCYVANGRKLFEGWSE